VLVDELGLEPSPELQRLQQQVLSADPELEPEPRTRLAVTMVNNVAPPAQLPPDIVDFVGRGETLDVIEQRLAPAGERGTAVPVATLTGMPGVGKTATAVHAAQRLRNRFPDGQLTADLRGLAGDPADPAEVLAGFLRAVGVGNDQMPATVEERSAMLRSWSANRKVLILLDDAFSSAQVRPLLPGGTDCAVIVTARSRLHGLAGAATIELDVMRPPEAVQLLTTIVGHKRAGLEPLAAEAIARQCGYLPLAIRAAAARLAVRPHWPLSKLAVRLALEANQLSELHTGELDLRACFEPSYRALNERERNAFRALSELDEVEFPTWMAAALLEVDGHTAETLLCRLREEQLLRVIRREPDGEIYYGFHEILRRYAREMTNVEVGEPMNPALAGRLPRPASGRVDDRAVYDAELPVDGRTRRGRRPPAPGVA